MRPHLVPGLNGGHKVSESLADQVFINHSIFIGEPDLHKISNGVERDQRAIGVPAVGRPCSTVLAQLTRKGTLDQLFKYLESDLSVVGSIAICGPRRASCGEEEWINSAVIFSCNLASDFGGFAVGSSLCGPIWSIEGPNTIVSQILHQSGKLKLIIRLTLGSGVVNDAESSVEEVLPGAITSPLDRLVARLALEVAKLAPERLVFAICQHIANLLTPITVCTFVK